MRKTVLCALALVVACSLASLLGCERYTPQSNDEEAVDYYKDKYHEVVSVSDSHGLGNYGLFGYSWSGTEYLMSDGTSVIYLDDKGVFSDNRQAAEIEAAAWEFAGQALGAIPGALTSVEIDQIGYQPYYETYEGETTCWSARYDGDIEAFLQSERPLIELRHHYSGDDYAEGRFEYSMAYDKSRANNLDEAYLDLSRFFDLEPVTLAVVDPLAFETKGDDLSLFDDGLLYTVGFRTNQAGKTEARHFKPVFVEIAEYMTASSETAGVVLKEGDIIFQPHESLDEGFYRCIITGDAASHKEEMEYYIRNDGPSELIRVTGIDQFSDVCGAYEHTCWKTLIDGGTYYIGDSSRIKPWIEIESVTDDRLVFSYHTYFKDLIRDVDLTVIGFAYKDGSSSSESTRFESRIVKELDDGWRCVVAIRDDARRDNTFSFQFTYNDDEDISVQIQQDVLLP